MVILSAGFAEAGPEGEALEAEVLRTARSWGVRVVGPNCLGLINTDAGVRLHATFADVPTRPGRLSLLSESGMLGAVLVTTAHEAGLGLSSFLALGNRADVSGNDLLQYWEADDTTDVVCMYIESFGNPRNFSRLARRLTRAKPVVAVKAGRLVAVDRDGVAGDATEDALLRQTGVIRVPTLDALLDTARLLLTPAAPRRPPRGRPRERRRLARHRRRRRARPPASSWPSWPRRPSPSVAAPALPDDRCPASSTWVPTPGPTTSSAPWPRSSLIPAWTRWWCSSPRASVRPPTRRSPRSSVGRKARPDVPLVVCAYGPRPGPIGRGPRLRRHRRGRRGPRPRGRLRRVARAAGG